MSAHPTGEAAGGASADDQHPSQVPLDAIAEVLLAQARQAHSGRAARTVYGGAAHRLRQTVIALTEGTGLGEHESPGEATVQVLSGRVTLDSGVVEVEASAGDLVAVPDQRHSLTAQTDATVLLTVRVR